jgi:hypothetical protein
MESKQRAILFSIAIALPLAIGLIYVALMNTKLPYSMIIPTAGGGLMNLGFWYFYKASVGAIPELRKIWKSQIMFLFVSILHLVAILILFVYDISWIFELF